MATERGHVNRTEIAAGLRLACQVTLRGALAVELPESTRPALPAGSFFQITAPSYRLDFAALEVPDTHGKVWAPIRALRSVSPTPETRAYSISNRLEASDAGRIVFNVRLALPSPQLPDAPPGKVSPYL